LIYKAQGTTAPGEGQETPAIFILGTDTAETFGDTATYQYNELGQLVQYLDLNGQTVTYTYDLNGLRSSKTVGGVTTKYYYDGDLVVNETDGTNLKATNLNGIQTEIRFTHEGETITAAYFLYDGHGDVMSVRNETLDEIANYEYDIYGEEKTSTGVYDSPIRYTGQYYDAETGMYYLRARYYDPSICRFISEDPAHDGRNWYAYCNGNPIKYWDPSGKSWQDYLFGMALAIDENNFGGVIQTVVGWIKDANNVGYIDSPYDYYNGRTIGDLLSMALGAGTSAWGVISALGSIVGGAAVSVSSLGTLSVGGVAISVSGVAAGTAATAYGSSVYYAASKKYDQDRKSVEISKGDFEKVDDKYLKKKGIDAHELKKENLKKGDKISSYDIYVNKKTGELWIGGKSYNSINIDTGIYIK
jgi:RHS repeat-associated protein